MARPGRKQTSGGRAPQSSRNVVRVERSNVASSFPSTPPLTNSNPLPPRIDTMLPLATIGLGRRILSDPVRPKTLHGHFAGGNPPVDQSFSTLAQTNGLKVAEPVEIECVKRAVARLAR